MFEYKSELEFCEDTSYLELDINSRSENRNLHEEKDFDFNNDVNIE